MEKVFLKSQSVGWETKACSLGRKSSNGGNSELGGGEISGVSEKVYFFIKGDKVP